VTCTKQYNKEMLASKDPKMIFIKTARQSLSRKRKVEWTLNDNMKLKSVKVLTPILTYYAELLKRICDSAIPLVVILCCQSDLSITFLLKRFGF